MDRVVGLLMRRYGFKIKRHFSLSRITSTYFTVPGSCFETPSICDFLCKRKIITCDTIYYNTVTWTLTSKIFSSDTLVVQVVLGGLLSEPLGRGCQAADHPETDVIRRWLKQVAAEPGSSLSEGFTTSIFLMMGEHPLGFSFSKLVCIRWMWISWHNNIFYLWRKLEMTKY